MQITNHKLKRIIRESIEQTISEGILDKALQAGATAAGKVATQATKIQQYAQQGPKKRALNAEFKKLKDAVQSFKTSADKITASHVDVVDFVGDLMKIINDTESSSNNPDKLSAFAAGSLD